MGSRVSQIHVGTRLLQKAVMRLKPPKACVAKYVKSKGKHGIIRCCLSNSPDHFNNYCSPLAHLDDHDAGHDGHVDAHCAAVRHELGEHLREGSSENGTSGKSVRVG